MLYASDISRRQYVMAYRLGYLISKNILILYEFCLLSVLSTFLILFLSQWDHLVILDFFLFIIFMKVLVLPHSFSTRYINICYLSKQCHFSNCFFMTLKKIIEVQLIYNLVLVSGIQQSDSVLYILFIFFTLFSFIGYYKIMSIVPSVIQLVLVGYLCSNF